MKPLAEEIRPTILKDFVGQKHLVGENKPIYNALKNNQIFSMILWGGSGTGKTTLARIIAKGLKKKVNFIETSAVIIGVKELKEIIENAQNIVNLNKQTIVFIDEIHHFSKSQQDVLLPHIESGIITLIGATTENPSFELNNAILSRLTVFVLEPLSFDDLKTILNKVVDLKPKNQDLIINNSNNDARKMLGIVERIAGIDEGKIADFLGEALVNFDKNSDIFYQQLSAFHKSVRGSSPDGALYWFARMLQGGAVATTIARRLLAIASEDIGLSDPRAIEITLNAWNIYHRVGKKEGERAIAEAIVYCAVAPKSNALYAAFNQVMADTKGDNSPVPKHLCNAPTSLLKEQGFGENYQYAHNFEDSIAWGQTYFPKEIGEKQYYQPVNRGLEIKIKDKLDKLRAKND